MDPHGADGIDPEAQRRANRPSPSRSDRHRRRPHSPPHGINRDQQVPRPLNYNTLSYQDPYTDLGNAVHGPAGSTMEALWPNIPYQPGAHSPSYEPVNQSDAHRPHHPHAHVSQLPYSSSVSIPAAHQQRKGGQLPSESRRPTVTQQNYNTGSLTTPAYGVPNDPSLGEMQQPSLLGPQNRDIQGIGPYPPAHPMHLHTYHPYPSEANRQPRSLSTHYHQNYGLSGLPGVSSFSSTGTGGIIYPLLSPDTTSPREAYSPGGYLLHQNELGPSADTPTATDGSGDLESDQDFEPGPSTSTSTPTSTVTPSNSSPTTSRWARFHVPRNVFTQPGEAVRHELYHQIRQEAWFISQTQERPITNSESVRIPGTVPGESVLLAFYDRETDGDNKPVMRCTICKYTNQPLQLFPRPDRARVHMRHHFEIRPVECKGKCTIPHCKQRFFTTGDLNAHISGKTEDLAKCEYCGKPLKPKNLIRHIEKFCHHAPPDVIRRRES